VTYGKSVVFSTNKIDRSDLTEILLKVALYIITLTITPCFFLRFAAPLCKPTFYLCGRIWINLLKGFSVCNRFGYFLLLFVLQYKTMFKHLKKFKNINV